MSGEDYLDLAFGGKRWRFWKGLQFNGPSTFRYRIWTERRDCDGRVHWSERPDGLTPGETWSLAQTAANALRRIDAMAGDK